MADFNTLFNKYLGVHSVGNEKLQSVNQAAGAKKVELGGLKPTDFYNIGAGISSGKGAESAGALEQDLRTLSPQDLSIKYGDQAEQLILGKARGVSDYAGDVTGYRTSRGVLGDTVNSVSMGLVNGIAGIGAIGLGLADKAGIAPEGSGVWAADKLGDLNTGARSFQTDDLNARRRGYEARQGMAERDNTAKFEKEKETLGSTVATANRIGRDIVDSIQNSVSDGVIVGDGVSSGVGSLFAGGAIGKVLKAGGKAAAASTAVGASGPSKASSMIASVTDKAAMPLAIGGLEAGGAYTGTVEDAIRNGATTEQANNAGLIAGAIQAPIGVATGALVSKFEGAPLTVGSLREAGSNIVRETIEEGVQSGSGQLAQNIGIKTVVDPARELSDNVGEQAGIGALYGMGTAGVLQAPGVVAKTTTDAAIAGAGAIAESAKAILARGDRILSEAEAASPMSAPNMTARQEAAAAVAPGLREEVSASVANAPPERAAELNTQVEQLFASADRFAELRETARIANDPNTPEIDRVKAGALLAKSFVENKKLLTSELPTAIQALDENDPVVPKLNEFWDVVLETFEHPEVKAAFEASQKAAQTVVNQLSNEAIATPEGQQAAEAVIELAGHAPEQANEEVLATIRAHVTDGRLKLTPEQKSTLEVASALVRATREIQEQKAALGLTYADKVTNEIQTRDEKNTSELVKKSAVEHAKGVHAAFRSGDRDLARTRLQDFMLFSQHMQNKVDAFNRNYASGRPDTKTSYQALSPKEGRPWFEAEGVFLNPKSEKSIQLAQQAALDARAVVTLANGVASAFPDLGVQGVTPVSLAIDPSLEKKAADVVREHQKAQKTASASQVNGDTEQTKAKTTTEVSPSEKVQQLLNGAVGETTSTKQDPDQLPLPFGEPVQPKTAPEPSTKKEEKPKTEAKKAEPAPKMEQVVEAAPVEAQETEALSNLLGSKKGAGWFKKAFRFPDVAKSRLLGSDKPVEFVSKALKSATALEAVVGAKLAHKLSPALAKTFSDYLSTAPAIQEAMAARVAEFLAKPVYKGGPTTAEAVLDPKTENPPSQWIRGKVLNILDVQEDGSLAYNEELVQSAILAGLQWLLSTNSRPARELDAEAVADLLGIDAAAVTEEQLDKFNRDHFQADAKRDVAKNILRFWGVQKNRNTPIGFTDGILEAVAAEVLLGMQEAGLVSFYKEQENGKDFGRMAISEDESFQEALKEMAQFPNAIEVAALTEPEELRFVGEPPKNVPEFQMRNRLVRNTEQQKQAIRNEQNTPHFINTNMVSFLETLGKEGVLFLFGSGEQDESTLNKNHALSLKGSDMTIGGAYDALVAMLSEVRNKAGAAGVDASEMPIHYEYNVSRVGRLHMLGLHNPQSSKLMREAILPTRVTLDLTDPAMKNKFMLAVAQAWGVKVHKKPRLESIQDVQSLADNELADALNVLGLHLSGSELTSESIRTLKQSFGGLLSPAAVHAAMEYQRWVSSTEEQRKAFTTDLYVEADGVTDGPINALVHLATGAFNARWVQLVAKGGLFFGSAGMTVNDFVRSGAEQSKDLYQTATDIFSRIMGHKRIELLSSPGLTRQMTNLMTLMDELLPDLTFDGQNLEVGRGIAKNPLTVTIYGSGANGIADKIVGALTQEFYKKLSENSPRLPELKAFIGSLTNQTIFNGKSGLYVADVSSKTQNPRDVSNRGYTLTESQLTNLRQNVLHLFVTPLQEAIEETIGDTQQGRTKLREAIQVQSIFLQYAFQEMVEKKLAEKTRKTDFLSQAELDAIYDELKKISPLIETGTQTFFVAGSDNTDVPNSELARGLKDELSTEASVYGPKDAGVAGIPYMVIGPGDGQMMQNLSTMDDAPQGTLKVFDGVHLKLDTLEEDSEKVNRAVYDAWLNNPLSNVEESFSKFLENISFENLSDKHWESLKKALYPQKEQKDVSNAEAEARVRAIGSQLLKLSQEAQARHNAMARVGMSVDHMASAEAPYQVQGEVSLEGLNEQQIADRLNELYEEELAKITTPKVEEKAPKVEPQPMDLASKVEVIPAQDFLPILNQMKINAEQRNLLKEAIKGLKGSWEVVRGTPEETAAYARSQGAAPYQGEPGETVHGYMSSEEQRIYLHTDAPETLVHELIHAAVAQTITNHYYNPKVSPSDVVEAIRNTEILMAQWLDMDHSDIPEDARQAYEDAVRTVKRFQNDTRLPEYERKAAALDEFLTWNLTNQSLIRLTQKTKVFEKIAQVVKRVLIAMKPVFWGRKMAPMVRLDMYSALRFNASLLINANQPTLQSRVFGTARFQSTSFGTSDRLSDLRLNLAKKIHVYLNEQPGPLYKYVASEQVKSLMTVIGDKVAESFMAHGFPMNTQEHSTFAMLMTVFATQAKLDQAALARVQELYTHVTKTLKVEDFMKDPNSQDPAERYYAQEKFNSVMGNYITEFDGEGRSTLLPAFLALAAVNSEFQAVLAKMPLPKSAKLKNDSLDNILLNAATATMDGLSQTLSGEGRNRPNVQAAIQVLTDRLAQTVEAQEHFIAQSSNVIGKAINDLNDGLVSGMQKASKAAIDKATELQGKTTNKTAKAALEAGKLIASVANEEESKLLAEGVISMVNRLKVFRPVHEFVNDLIGRTESNAQVFDMIKKVRSYVQQMRQQFREHLPELISKRFTRELSKEEWTQLFKGMAKTDLAALSENFTHDQIIKLLGNPAQVKVQIRQMEDLIQREVGNQNWPLIQKKAKQLAHYMNTGEVGENLLRNAEAVSKLFNVLGKSQYVPTEDVINSVDQLVSLYALEETDPTVRDTLNSLAQEEAEGMEFVMAYLVGQRTDELSKLKTDKARVNHYKGYVPSEAQAGAQLIVAEDGRYAELVQLGYQRVASYDASRAEVGAVRKSYYFSPVSGRALFNQGIMQNVRQTASGVDPVTGHTYGPMTAGRIVDPTTVNRITRNRLAGRTGQPLMPIFDQDGQVIAYERSVDPNQEQRLNRNTNLAQMIGVWRGRQAEEALAGQFNQMLIGSLYEMWSQDKLSGQADQYINLFDKGLKKKDPVAYDAVSLFTDETKEQIEDLFGNDGFPVRLDMLNDAVGYRSASVGDAWTGNTRWDPKSAETVKRAVIGVMGMDAYKILITGEKLLQNLVTDARQLIVVKSVVVPVSNLIANMYQMMARGVGVARIAKGMPEKLSEVNAYVTRRTRQIEVEAELRAAENDIVKTRKLKAELQSLQDANKRMSIWPLIEAGEFSSISEAGTLEKEALTLYEGRLTEYIEQLVDRLPPGIRTAGKYAIVSQDTALFQGMRKAMEYGDFLAKAITYDHLTQDKKKTREEALAAITEEFVNYDRLAGRSRSYLESIGLLWFYNFKVRIAKIAVATIRNNPLHALLAGLIPMPDLVGSIGTPLSDNVFSVGLQGDLEWSIGPGMGLNSWQLHPLAQILR